MEVAYALDSEDDAGHEFKPYHPGVRAFQRPTSAMASPKMTLETMRALRLRG
jgi:hypothetical protein